MTRTTRIVSKIFFGLFLFSLLQVSVLDADIALTAGQYGLPYQWQMRRSSFYNPTQQQLFAGSIAPDSGQGLVVSAVEGSGVFNYSPAGLTAGVNTDANGYEKRPVWDMSLVYQGATPTPWLAIIMANATGTAPDRQMYLVNTNNPTQVISFTNFQNSSAGNGLPFKVCMAERSNSAVAAGDKQVLVVAISGSTSDTALSHTGSCLRMYKIDAVGGTLTEFASSKIDGSTIDTFSELRDMWWDSTLKRLYCGFARTVETKVGIACLYFDEATAASPVIKRLKLSASPANTEFLTAPASGNSLIPYVHKVRTFTTNPLDAASVQNRYLIINGGKDPASYNKIYALPLVNRNVTHSDGTNDTHMAHGAIDVKVNAGLSGAGVAAHDNSWLDQTNDISLLTAGLNSSSLIALRTVGAGPLPVGPSVPVTDIQMSGLNVYVSVADTTGGECLFVSTAILRHSGGTQDSTPVAGQNSRLIGWTPWKKVVDATLNSPIICFGISGSPDNQVVALRDDNTVITRATSAFPTFVTIPQRSFSQVSATKLDLADTTTMWRNRRLSVFDATMRRWYAGTTLPNQEANSLMLYLGQASGSAPASAALTSATRLININNQPIWTMTGHGSSIFVVPHTEIGQTYSYGGKNMYVLSEGLLYAQNLTADVKDMSGAASRVLNLAAGKKGNEIVVMAAIPDAVRNDFASTYNNCVRLFRLQQGDIPALTKDDSFVYDLRPSGAPLALQAGQSGAALTYRALEDMHYDSVMNGVYLAFSKSSDGNGSHTDAGLTLVGWNTVGAASRTSGKLLEGTVADATGFKHVLKVRTMHTRVDITDTTRTRSYLVFNGTNYAGVASDGSGIVNAKLNRIYALPLVSSGADLGKIATSTTHATAAVLASQAWSETGNAGADYGKHVVGGGYLPTHARAVVTDMVVAGKSVFVSVANPQGVEGVCGVFVSTALTDDDEKLVSWTAWKKVIGDNANIAAIGYNAHSDTLMTLNHDSSRVEETSWRSHSVVTTARDGIQNILSFVKNLETDFASSVNGMYNIQNMLMLSNDNATNVNMLGAFGYNKVAIGHVAKKTAGDMGSCKYPYKLETSRYKMYDSDSVLAGIRSLYCMALPQRLPGWVFVGGNRGLAVLCRSSDGRGWTSLPASFNDTTGSQPALSAQSWKQITEVVGPVYKIVTMTVVDTSSSSLAPLVICMTKKGIQAFIATENKFKATTPAALGLFDTTTIFTDPGEYMRDIAVVGGKMLLVGTTKGLYLLQVSDNADSFISPITPVLYLGAHLGPIGSIKITSPSFATIDSTNPTGLNNAWLVADVLTSRVLKNKSEHFQFKIKLNSTGSVVSTTTPAIKRALTQLEGKIFTSGDATYYVLPGKHLSTSGGIDVYANGDGSDVNPFSTVKNDSQIGEISEVAVDGTRVVTAGGSVYVYRT